MIRRIVPAALAGLCACAPVVTHGPRVEPGTQVTVNAGLPLRECGQGDACGTGVTPEMTVGVRRGFVPDSGRGPALLAGVALPVFDLAAPELDVYAQAPAPGMFAAGAGALASPHHLMPYVQAGLSRPNGDGWFATAGYAWLFADPRIFILSERPRMLTPPRYWAPSIGFHGHLLGRNLTAYASGALGHYVEPEHAPIPGDTAFTTTPVRRGVRMLVVGITAQASLDDVRAAFPFPFPRE